MVQNTCALEELKEMAGTLLASAGLSSSLFHWALLLYLADTNPSTELTADLSQLLCLGNTYDFGLAAMPRVIDALCCASNFEAVYLLIPSLLQSVIVNVDDRIAIRLLLVTLIRGNAPLIGSLVAASRGKPWRSVALHVASVAASKLKSVSLLEGIVKEEEEDIVESALLRGVGTSNAQRTFIDFLILQRRYARALALCESFTSESADDHQAIAGLVATLRCLVPRKNN
eukprot:GILJ01028379.1.p1 GENE.GILJ01028379.1~~GILJ01028379.1.p1  ORF type:complete len:229 (-),score=28.81 GILJ01028379.1:37-723(-)